MGPDQTTAAAGGADPQVGRRHQQGRDGKTADTSADLGQPRERDLIEDEMLVEEISIDGMCGVY